MANDYLTIDDVRNYMFDRTVKDNELDMDLSFSNDEIADAMRRAARETNDIPPNILFVTADKLPGNSAIWLHAVAEQLYLSKLQQLMRNDVTYDAGGVKATITANRINHFKELIKLERSLWEPRLRSYKVGQNFRRFHFYGG
jgi:hypothetical protein